MALAERRASVVWNGGLADGDGTVSFESSGTARLPATWASRTESPDGKTSPEEMIAGAHATCYAMAFANTLAQAGYSPQQLTVIAVCSLDQVEGGLQVTESALTVTGAVEGIDEAEFQDLAIKGELGCPVSNALRNNVNITVSATLET